MVIQTDRCFACTGCPHAPRRGIGVRTRQRHLAAAPGSGTLPPLCVIERLRSEGAGLPPCRGVVKAGARSPRPCDGEGAGLTPQKRGVRRKADAVRRVPGLLALLALLPFKSLTPKSSRVFFGNAEKHPAPAPARCRSGGRGAKRPRWGFGAKPRAAGGMIYQERVTGLPARSSRERRSPAHCSSKLPGTEAARRRLTG